MSFTGWFGQGDTGGTIATAAIRELREPDSVTPIALEGLALQMLARMARVSAYESVHRPPTWLTTVRDYLHDHYRSGIRLTDVARAVDVHPDHVSRVFSQRYGITFGEYLRQLRTDAAAELLASSRLSISAVAQRAGFSDQSHLTRIFKRRLGITPARYRAAHRR